MPIERRKDSKRLRPTCFRCGRTWPDPGSRLCGYCRVDLGFPGIVTSPALPERTPARSWPKIYRATVDEPT